MIRSRHRFIILTPCLNPALSQFLHSVGTEDMRAVAFADGEA
jgi:hypothetical protein